MQPEFKLSEDETLDGPIGLKITQKRNGYRYSQDSLQLADFARVKPSDAVIDLGTGCGVMSLILAGKGLGERIVGLEIQKDLAALATRNVESNGFKERIEIIEGDIRKVKSLFPPQRFDYALSNPPYMGANAGRISPGCEKAVARHEILCSMKDVLAAIKYLLKPLRRGACIYPSSRSAELVFEAKKKGLEPKRLQLIHPSSEEKAELVMIEFVKGGRPGVEVLAPLVHERPR